MSKTKFLSVILSITLFSANAAALADGNFYAAEPYELFTGFEPRQEPTVVEVDEDAYYHPAPNTLAVLGSSEEEDIPEKYLSEDYGYVTVPKNQGNLGVCWAFTAAAAMESSILKKDLATADELDYSEYHLAYFTHKRNTTTGDGEDTTKNGSYFTGGHYLTAAMKLVGWQGTELEENYPYNTESMPNIDESARYSSYAHLQDYYMLKTADDIKKAVMEYGGVAVAYYHDSDSWSSSNAVYYNSTSSGEGHAVFIVGWDDKYAVSNFSSLSEQPKNPGAWRIKNSWGATSADNGYFWMSYETKSMQDFVAFNAESADNYQIIHQYDGADYKSIAKYPAAANIFTADSKQSLKAVGFNTYHTNAVSDVDYKIEVYKLEDEPDSPTDGDMVSTVEGTVKYDGYHTVTLDTPVMLDNGDKFSAVVSLTEADGTTAAYQCFEGGKSNYSSNEGESWVLSQNKWYDCTKVLNNVCIKAYSTCENVTIHFETNGAEEIADKTIHSGAKPGELPTPTLSDRYFAGWYLDSGLTTLFTPDTDRITENTTLWAKWSDEPIAADTLTLSANASGMLKGDNLELTAAVTPYYATDKKVSFVSSNEDILTVSKNGTVTGISAGEAAVTATVGTLSQSITLTVYNPLGNITFASQKSVYKTTDNPTFYVDAPNATNFELYILNEKGNSYRIPVDKETPYSFYIDPIEANSYYYYIVAYDALGNTKTSGIRYFMVSDDKVLVVQKTGANKFISCGYNSDNAGKIIAGAYDAGDRLIAVQALDNSNEAGFTAPFNDIDQSYSYVKFMWWNSTDEMCPLTSSVIFTQSGDITLVFAK